MMVSPYINRFISADTIVPGYANRQNLNRYSYVTNNPLRYTDPTGHMLCAVCEGEGGDGYTPPNAPNFPNAPDPDDPDQDDENTDPDCPDWNVCIIDVPGEIIQSYWDANNGFLNSTNGSLLGLDLLGLGSAALAYLTGTHVISAESIALILGLSLVDPTPIEEIIIVGGLVVAATAITANLVVNDIQNVNNAMVISGALENGGTIVANWDGVTITTPEGSTSVNTLVPFSSQISLGIWANGNSLLIPGYPNP